VKAPSNLALGFATIERPQVVQRLIRSAREHLGPIPIYVADQSRDIDAISSFYEAFQVNVVRMPFDAGVTASRNRIAQSVREEFFVLCDDDFVIGPQSEFGDALRIFESDPGIGVIGGRLYDFDGEVESVRNWELYLQYDPRQRLLLTIPIYEFAPRAREIGGVRYYLCDAVLNFSVMRTQMFRQGVGWDERFKSNGEHEDFFLNLKLNSPYKVAYLPTMRAYHHHPEEYRRYRSRLRDRNDGWRRFLAKWKIDQHLELGLGVKTIDDLGAVTGSEAARARFFVNGDLSLQRSEPSPGTVLVNLAGERASVGALSAAGETMGAVEPTGRLLLDRRSGSIVAGPEPSAEPRRAGPALSRTELFEKYRLEVSGGHQPVGFAAGELHYRYDTILRRDSDFLLWYFRGRAPNRALGAAQRLAVVARWTGSDGGSLVWRTRRTFIDLEPAEYWRPLLLEAPPAPRRLKWMRFDLLTDVNEESQTVCTGFLSCTDRDGAEGLGGESLGVSRLIRDGMTPEENGTFLAELGKRAKSRRIGIGAGDPAGGLSELRLDDCEGLEALFLVGWRGLGRAIVGARLPPGKLKTPTRIVLPAADVSDRNSRIYGFGRAVGLLALRYDELGAGSRG
jgi:GT2 family glycosyltransferase